MDPRMGRRSGYHDQEEADIVSPQAARLHGGFRSGPRRERQGYGPESGGPGPSGRARQGNAYNYEDIVDNEEAETPRHPISGGCRQRDVAETGFADAGPSAHRHNVVSERPSRGDERGSESKDSGAFFNRRNPARGSQLDHFEDGQLDHMDDDDDDDALEAAGARPSRRNPIRQGQRDNRRAGENSEDNERYGGSRRGGGNRARDRSEDGYDGPDPGPSRALVGGRGTRQDKKQERRFIPYNFEMLHPVHVDFLAQHFKVRRSKIREWCEEDYIRLDTKKGNETNIDPLLDTLTSKDRERYEKVVQRNRHQIELQEVLGHGGYRRGRATTAFDRGYDARQVGERRRRRSLLQ